MHDVLIVGAGPVGLTMALECIRHGVSFRLVDRLPAPVGLSKALAIWSGTIEMLDRLGLAGRFLERAIHGKGMRLCRGRRLLVEIPAGIGLDSPFPKMLLLPQSATEEILGGRLSELGGKVERGVELVGLDPQRAGVVAKFRGSDGLESMGSFRWVAACDGAHSTVRHLAGMGFDGDAIDQDFVLCDAGIDGDITPGFAHLFWSPDGLLAVFPVVPGVWRVISSRSGKASGDPALAEMQELVDARGPGGWKLTSPTWMSAFRISERKVSHYRSGRILFAGDAAHIHSPAGGQGMNTGMQDAANLAWKLGVLAAGFGSEDEWLESYHRERSPVAEKVLRESGRMLRTGFVKNPVLQFVRDGAVRLAGHSVKVKKSMMRSLSGLDLSYPRGLLVSGDALWHEDWRPHGFAPGTRLRDAAVRRDGEQVSLLQETRSPFFTLLIFSGRKPIYRDVDRLAAVQLVASGYGRLVRTVSVWHGAHPPDATWLLDPDASAHKKFGVELPSFYLIRPDGYVGTRCQPAEAAALHEWLGNALPASGNPD